MSRNDIWFNLKQIQSATSTIQQTYPGIPFEFHNPLETDKDKVKRQKANGATARSMQKDMIQYFTKNLLPLYEEMEALYKNNVIPFENTDDEYVKTAKEKMETYLDPAKLLATAQKQNRGAVVNFVKGMWSSVKGVVGLAKTAVEYSVAGTAFVYGKVTGKMPKWAEKRMGNAKEFAKKVWQDPFSILEGMGQGLSDTYENEGVSYLAGAFVGDYLIAKGATKAVKAMKKPKSGKVGSEVGGGKKASGAGKVFKPEKLVLENGEIAFKSNNGVLVRSADYLDEFGNIKWPLHDGFVLDSAGKPIMKNVDLKTGQILDRYGNPSGTFTSPVENGKIPSYDTRGLPYPESVMDYHQYEVIKDVNMKNVQQGYKKLSDLDKEMLDTLMARYEFTLEDIASPKLGNISEVFGAGGGTQIQFGTSVEWYEKMGILKEIK